MLPTLATSTLESQYQSNLAKLNPLMKLAVDPSTRVAGNVDNLVTRLEAALFDQPQGIPGVFEGRQSFAEGKPVEIDHSWDKQGEKDEPVARKIAQHFQSLGNLGTGRGRCRVATREQLDAMIAQLKEDTKTFYAGLVDFTLKSAYLRVFPEGKYSPAGQKAPDLQASIATAHAQVVSQLNPFWSCLEGKSGDLPTKAAKSREQVKEELNKALGLVKGHSSSLNQVLSLSSDLAGQFALGLETALLGYTSSNNLDVSALLYDIDVLSRAYFFLYYRLKLDTMEGNAKWKLTSVSSQIAKSFAGVIAQRGQFNGEDRRKLEGLVIAGYAKALSVLKSEGASVALDNLKLFWGDVTGSGRGPTQLSRPDVAKTLEGYLLTNLKPNNDDRLVTLAHEVVTFAGSASQDLSDEWLDAYINKLSSLGHMYGLLPFRVGTLSKVLMHDLVPNVNHRAAEINHQMVELVLEFLRTDTQFDDDPQSFPYRFSCFLDSKYQQRHPLMVALYPLAKLFNMWACNTERMLPHISFAKASEEDVKVWFESVQNLAMFDDFKQFLVNMNWGYSLSDEKRTWENIESAHHLLANQITWRQARNFNKQWADLLDTRDDNLGSAKRALHQLKI